MCASCIRCRQCAAIPTVLTQLVTGGDIKVPGDDTPRIFVLHRPTLSGERGAGVIRNLLADGWVVVTEFDDHPDHFGMLNADDELAFRGVHAVQTSTPALGRDPAHAQSRSHGVPQHDPRAAGCAQFRRSAGADAVLRRAEPRARLGAADAGAERGGGEGGRAAALSRGARPGVLRRAAHAAQAVHADLRLRHLSGAARASARSRSCRWRTRRSIAPSRI